MSEPLISVVIANYNRRDDLAAALASVEAQRYPRVETIVVDNASTDGSRTMLARDFPEVKIVGLGENQGMAGYAAGFGHARGELLFQMDNDSLMPTPDVLTEVERRFADGPPTLAAVATRVEEFRPGDDVETLRRRDERRGPIPTGGFHSGGVGFRRALLAEVGSYSRAVFLYGSELFVQMKLLARGWGVDFFPEILMLHKSSGTARTSRGLYYEVRNRLWFLRRFATRGQQARFLPRMLLHDALWAVAERRPGAVARAVVDGLRPLPAELRPPLRSPLPAFRAKVEEVGRTFGLRPTVERTWRRLAR
jgi:GT2 family glycosyltransferase